MKRVFVLDDDPNTLQLLRLALEAEGYQPLTASDSRQGLRQIRAEQPDLLILDIMMPDLDGFEVCHQLRQAPETENLPIIMLSARGEVSDRVKALKMGADDYISKPVDMDEIIARVGTLLTLGDAHSLRQGQTTVCIGVKGGVGVTAIAVNLATTLAMESAEGTVLVDGCFQFGGVHTALNIRSSHGLVDLLPYASHLESDVVSRVLTTHHSGLRVLLPPSTLEEVEAIQPPHVEAILTKLREMFDHIVVDAWPFLNPLTLAVLGRADEILLILTPEISSLHRARLWLDIAERRGYAGADLRLVLNRDRGQAGFDRQKIAQMLGYPLSHTFPSEPRLVTHALNRGVPLALDEDGGPWSRSLRLLARQIRRQDPSPEDPRPLSPSQGVLDHLRRAMGRE